MKKFLITFGTVDYKNAVDSLVKSANKYFDNKGNILDFIEHNPSKDLFNYNSENVVLEIYSKYKYIINKI